MRPDREVILFSPGAGFLPRISEVVAKASKQRFCPAAQRQITSGECGEGRGSRYGCPADCSYSPLAPDNYEMLLKLEEEVDGKCMERLREAADRNPQLLKEVEKAMASPNLHTFQVLFLWRLFFEREAGGLTLAEQMEREGFRGLKNDGRVILRAKMRIRVALLEVHRIIDKQRLEVVDLLASQPEPMLVCDRTLASLSARFTPIVGWVYPLPHYWRLHGTAIVMPEMTQFEPVEIIREIARHLGGPEPEDALRLWLAGHFVQVDEAVQATARMRRLQMFAGLDVQYGKAVYELRAPFAECRDSLDELAEVLHDTLSVAERDEGFAEARVWLAGPEALKVGAGRPTLGRVLLGQSHCRLEAMSAGTLAQLREQFEARLGERARFTGELRDDMGARLAEREPKPNEALVPPKLLEQPSKLVIGTSILKAREAGESAEDIEAAQADAYHHAFLDQAVPALDGHTPREAARDPALRPRLVRLLKQFVRSHDERNLETGRNDDINWMLRELDAREILFDAPPPRPRPPEFDEEDEEEAEELPGDDADLPFPTLPPGPFSLEEVQVRFKASTEDVVNHSGSMREFDSPGYLDDAFELCGDWVGPEDFEFLIPFLLQARLILSPRGFAMPPLNYGRMEEAFEQTLKEMSALKPGCDPDALLPLLTEGRQPALIQFLGIALSDFISDSPKKERPKDTAELGMMLVLKHVIDEMDQVLREGQGRF
jgi:hypothetical protein